MDVLTIRPPWMLWFLDIEGYLENHAGAIQDLLRFTVHIRESELSLFLVLKSTIAIHSQTQKCPCTHQDSHKCSALQS